ncbi:MAG TPA: hypothetical protein VKB80_06415, partial [Kofleriaceae bacterium]|nr:hypothetical protein [Kofleriaceae bacterium]
VEVELGPDVRLRAIPAAPSLEGTEQCALLFETPDVVLLDAVDVRDTAELRAALEEHRGRIDLAFLPSAASLQWQGCWNQMDAVGAADLASWLDARLVATCGGALSASGPQQLGILERYPCDRADWQAAAAARLPVERVVWHSPPFELRFVERSARGARPLTLNRVSRDGHHEVQALVAAFFTGYLPDAPMRLALGGPAGIGEAAAAWAPHRSTLAAASVQVEGLLRRCHPAEHRTFAGVLAPGALRHLARVDAVPVAARLACVVPEPAPDGAAVVEHFFWAAEALLRAEMQRSPAVLRDLLACLAFDRGMALLAREEGQMRQLGNLTPEQLERGADAQVEALRRTMHHRRPVLAPNHVWVDAADIELVTGARPGPEVRALLCCAGATGVHSILLDEIQALILEQCDGRPLPAIARDLAEQLAATPSDMERAVFRVLADLTRTSVHALFWSVA